MADTQLTWLGHASFRFDSPGGKRVYVDPFLNGNPKTPDDEKEPERIDLIAVTHGHGDHWGDTTELAKKHGCVVVAPVELADWSVMNQGLDQDKVRDPNKGGTVDVDGIQISVTNAHHSSSNNQLEYMGEPVGYVFKLENGTKIYFAGDTCVFKLENGTKIYFAGDTCVFGDMQLIARLYEPDVAVIPIGDHYTMGPKEAALALELLGNPRCVPCHWGTFPALTGTPEKLRELAPQVDVIDVSPGETVTV